MHNFIQFNKKAVRDYFFIMIGAAIMAIGIGIFLVDAKVVPGGVSGLSMAFYYLTDGALPIGVTIWLLNIPLFIWGVKELGTQFGTRTFVGFTLNSFLDIFVRGEMPGFSFIQLQNTETILKLRQDDFLFLIMFERFFLELDKRLSTAVTK